MLRLKTHVLTVFMVCSAAEVSRAEEDGGKRTMRDNKVG